MPTNDTPVTVKLACGHRTASTFTYLWTYKELSCWACKQNGRTVNGSMQPWVSWDIMTVGYAFACKGCRYKRAYGLARISCETAAASHSIRKLHTISLTLDGEEYRLITKNIEPLPLDGSPPF